MVDVMQAQGRSTRGENAKQDLQVPSGSRGKIVQLCNGGAYGSPALSS